MSITASAVDPIDERPGNDPFASWCAPTYAIADRARSPSWIAAWAALGLVRTTDAMTSDVVMRHRDRPMESTPSRASARPSGTGPAVGVVAGRSPGGPVPLAAR